MKQFTGYLKRHSLVSGILLMYLLTWPVGLSTTGLLPYKVPFVVSIFVGWGIIFASILITGLTLGNAGIISLLKRYMQWRVNWKWYLAAFLLGPILITLAVFINATLTGVAPDFSTVMAYKIFGQSAKLFLLILPWFVYEILSNGEEIGWRGYVLPRLQVKHSSLTASLIIGIVWGIWHLPNFLQDFDALRFCWFMAHITATSLILTWIYNGTQGSLLLTTLYHATLNTAGMFMPMANTVSSDNIGAYMIYVLLEVITAVVIVMLTGPELLSTKQPMQLRMVIFRNYIKRNTK